MREGEKIVSMDTLSQVLCWWSGISLQRSSFGLSNKAEEASKQQASGTQGEFNTYHITHYCQQLCGPTSSYWGFRLVCNLSLPLPLPLSLSPPFPPLSLSPSPPSLSHLSLPLPLSCWQAQQTSTCGAAASSGSEYICDICMLSFPLAEMSGLECGHLFCRTCWDTYLTVMIMCEGRGQTISCPATACDIVVNEQLVL